ncbi:hypothetical protein [Marinomonas rhodophyticola]|uniref:Uncharacterized protein n=1 Tax=Marinomonas rhodophyticola TaxID=2992803 RepID=A0ABT3KEC4_9GAMM|nr:hypothetical protein [Marinomonas sp. KJ51-3]MCW4628853.1 hypothetical protein [Marinomonas sp. KJ51-3]
MHDTFHHKGAGEEEFFPERTGLIHISGLEDDITFNDMLDGDRVLVGPKDRLDNIEQLRTLLAAGYLGRCHSNLSLKKCGTFQIQNKRFKTALILLTNH